MFDFAAADLDDKRCRVGQKPRAGFPVSADRNLCVVSAVDRSHLDAK